MGLRLEALRALEAPLWCLFLTGPSAPPKSVRAVTRTMYSIGVKWDEVPESFRNGDIMSYTITYHSDTSSGQQQKQFLSPLTRFASLTHLTKNTNYTITVLASNEKGPGPASDPIVVATSDGSKYSFCSITNLYPMMSFWTNYVREDSHTYLYIYFKKIPPRGR